MASQAHLNTAQRATVAVGAVAILAVFLYPPWVCIARTGGGMYRVAPAIVERLRKGEAITSDFAPNIPIAYCPGPHEVARTIRYAWLFRPPTEFGGRRWAASVDWAPVLKRFGFLLIALVILAYALKTDGVILRALARLRRHTRQVHRHPMNGA